MFESYDPTGDDDELSTGDTAYVLAAATLVLL
jgi:hypothetical protein